MEAVVVVGLVRGQIPVEPYRQPRGLQRPEDPKFAEVAYVARVPVLHLRPFWFLLKFYSTGEVVTWGTLPQPSLSKSKDDGMSLVDEREYWAPEHTWEYLRRLGFHLPLEAMGNYIRTWHEWMSAVGGFYDYRDYVGCCHMLRTGRPFREGNGRAMRIWLDAMLKAEIGKAVVWCEGICDQAFWKPLDLSKTD